MMTSIGTKQVETTTINQRFSKNRQKKRKKKISENTYWRYSTILTLVMMRSVFQHGANISDTGQLALTRSPLRVEDSIDWPGYVLVQLLAKC